MVEQLHEIEVRLDNGRIAQALAWCADTFGARGETWESYPNFFWATPDWEKNSPSGHYVFLFPDEANASLFTMMFRDDKEFSMIVYPSGADDEEP